MTENVKSFHGPLSERVRYQTVQHCQSLSGRMLDVGCGNGLLFEALASVSPLKGFGVDRSTELLADVNTRFDGRISGTNGLIDHLPFKDCSFDVVTCLNTLLNLPSLDVVGAALREMMRISANRVIVDIRNGSNPILRFRYWQAKRHETVPTVAYRLREIRAIFQAGGFVIEEAYPVGIKSQWLAWGYVVVARRRH